MKLIKDFRERCNAEYGMLFDKPSGLGLPKRFYDWWVFEEGDLDFIPEASWFSKSGSFDDYSDAVREIRRNYGFFRKKNTKAELEKQQEILDRFPLDLIVSLAAFHDDLRLRKVYVNGVRSKLQAITKPVNGRLEKTNEELIQSLRRCEE